ncbi:MAG: S8 family peptidase [Promethearchaeota archaeon]
MKSDYKDAICIKTILTERTKLNEFSMRKLVLAFILINVIIIPIIVPIINNIITPNKLAKGSNPPGMKVKYNGVSIISERTNQLNDEASNDPNNFLNKFLNNLTERIGNNPDPSNNQINNSLNEPQNERASYGYNSPNLINGNPNPINSEYNNGGDLNDTEPKGTYLMQGALGQEQVFPYLHENLGLKGDPYSAVAIVDSGIDVSHPMLPGYGINDSSKKVIFWKDFTPANSSTPYDNDEHGTLVSSILAGEPYNLTDSNGRISASRTSYRDWSGYNFNLSISYIDVFMSFNVLKAGNITVYGKWSKPPDSYVNIYKLCILDANGNYVKNVSITEDVNTTIEYSVPASNLGVYKVGFVYNVSNINSVKYTLFADTYFPYVNNGTYSLIQGVAPNTKIVMLKMNLLESEIVNALDWILNNGKKYNVTTISLSFKIASNLVKDKIEKLVNAGYIVVAAAGNDYYGGNYAGSFNNVPASMNDVISVGAIDNRNHVSSYSSEGGVSFMGDTSKPDCLAPGGDFASKYDEIVPLLGADANEMDDSDETQYPDRVKNNTATGVGTSFSAPFAAGVIQLLIQALGGAKNWNYTKEDVLKVKSMLLMTSSETYPNHRNGYGGTIGNNPALNRGDKDPQEGYGRINPKALIDMVLYNLTSNSTISEYLTSQEALSEEPYNNSVYSTIRGENEFCFARGITLKPSHYYEFTLTPPANADYDLYLYSTHPSEHGDPIIIEKSTHNGTGPVQGRETIRFSPQSNEKYYIIVKSVSGKGNFTLNFTDFLDITPPTTSKIYLPQNNSYIHGLYRFIIFCNDSETRVTNINIYAAPSDALGNIQSSQEAFKWSENYSESLDINTTMVKDGWYILTLEAIDANNNKLNSSHIIVCIDNTPPEVAEILSPHENAKLSGYITIQGAAYDYLSGLYKVEFYVFTRSQAIFTDYGPFSSSINETNIFQIIQNKITLCEFSEHYPNEYHTNTCTEDSYLSTTLRSWDANLLINPNERPKSPKINIVNDVKYKNIEYKITCEVTFNQTDKSPPITYISFKWLSNYTDDGINYVHLKAYDKAGNYRLSHDVEIIINNFEDNLRFTITLIIVSIISLAILNKLALKILLNIDLARVPDYLTSLRDKVIELVSSNASEENEEGPGKNHKVYKGQRKVTAVPNKFRRTHRYKDNERIRDLEQMEQKESLNSKNNTLYEEDSEETYRTKEDKQEFGEYDSI